MKRNIDFKHFCARLKERYNMIISRNQYEEIVSNISSNRLQKCYVSSSSIRRKIYKVIIQGQIVPVVYDSKQRSLVTALPKWSY